MQYHIRQHASGNVSKPMTIEVIVQFAKQGRIKKRDEIKEADKENWTPIYKVKQLNDVIEAASAQPARIPPSQTPPSARAAKVREQETTYDVAWPDGRSDGSFTMATLRELANDGFLRKECKIRKRNATDWNDSFQIAGIWDGINMSRYYVRWEEDRMDGPFFLTTIIEMMKDGFIFPSCQFMGRRDGEWQDGKELGIPVHHCSVRNSNKYQAKAFIPLGQRIRKKILAIALPMIILIASVAVMSGIIWAMMNEDQKTSVNTQFDAWTSELFE